METVHRRTRTFWLSMHVPYACRHAGACCSAGWQIPVERGRVAQVTLLRRDAWLRPLAGAPPDVAGTLAVSESGHCVFHHAGCEIQHAFGHAALPSACQHFPRVVLLDPRGVFVTLSHYCPTAADLLFSHVGPVEVVEGPAVLPDGVPEGLDARDVLPPLLVSHSGRSRRPQSRVEVQGQSRVPVLMDWEACSAWEAHMVAVLTRTAAPAEETLAALEADMALLQRWRPGADRSLAEQLAALPKPGSQPPASSAPASEEVVVGRYLAARAFASWIPYQHPDGVVGGLRSLRATLKRLRRHQRRLSLKEAIRRTDWQFLHVTR